VEEVIAGVEIGHTMLCSCEFAVRASLGGHGGSPDLAAP
jgi:hypothetical protein